MLTAMQVAPNTAADGALLAAAALPALKQRTAPDTLYTDGAYGGPERDPVLCDQHVTLIQSAIKGRKPAPDKLDLADFAIMQDDQGVPLRFTCLEGQTAPATPGPTLKELHVEIYIWNPCAGLHQI